MEQRFLCILRDLVIPPATLAWLQSELVQSDQTERAALENPVRRQQIEVWIDCRPAST
jgi:hypothetical protein